jgi:hypothetical protein
MARLLVGDRKALVWSVIARRHQDAIWCEEPMVADGFTGRVREGWLGRIARYGV